MLTKDLLGDGGGDRKTEGKAPSDDSHRSGWGPAEGVSWLSCLVEGTQKYTYVLGWNQERPLCFQSILLKIGVAVVSVCPCARSACLLWWLVMYHPSQSDLEWF